MAFLTRGLIYYNQEDLEKAIADYTSVIAVEPRNPEALRNRGRAYAEKNDPARALPDLNEAIRLNPQDAEALLSRGLVHHGGEEFEKAIADYTAVIAITRDSACGPAHRPPYLATNQYEKALADCDTAIRLDPKDVDTLFSRATIHHDREDLEKAVADYTAVLTLEPKKVRCPAQPRPGFFREGGSGTLAG